MSLGARDYACDIGGREYSFCECVGEEGHVTNVASIIVENVGGECRSFNTESCIFSGI